MIKDTSIKTAGILSVALLGLSTAVYASEITGRLRTGVTPSSANGTLDGAVITFGPEVTGDLNGSVNSGSGSSATGDLSGSVDSGSRSGSELSGPLSGTVSSSGSEVSGNLSGTVSSGSEVNGTLSGTVSSGSETGGTISGSVTEGQNEGGGGGNGGNNGGNGGDNGNNGGNNGGNGGDNGGGGNNNGGGGSSGNGNSGGGGSGALLVDTGSFGGFSSGTSSASINGSGALLNGGGALGSSTPGTILLGTCRFMTAPMRFGIQNDPVEVTEMQNLLNRLNLGSTTVNNTITGTTTVATTSLAVNGIFDRPTEQAVKLFQSTYASEILAPWGVTTPTGFVYVTTLKKMNALNCNAVRPFTEEELNIIQRFKTARPRQNRTNSGQRNGGQNVPAGTSVEATTTTGTTTNPEELIGVNPTGQTQTASVSNVGANAITRFVNFIRGIFKR